MSWRSFRGVPSIGPRTRRVLWAAMAILHAPAFFSAWKSLGASGLDLGLLAKCIGLSASMLLFVLRFQDVAFLRWRTDRRSCIAIGLVIAVAHLGLLEPATDEVIWLEYGPLVSCTFLLGQPSRMSEDLRAVWARLRQVLGCSPSSMWLHGTIGPDLVQVRCWTSLSPTCAPRSPPA